MTFFMEVEPPVATLPDRLPEAVEAAEEAVDAAAEEAAVEEAEPPQAVRAAAAAAAPQTARNERRVIFFIMFSSITISRSYFPGLFFLFVFSLGTPLLYRRPSAAATTRGKNRSKLFAQAFPAL
jgi:hypothetical protein